MPYTHTQKNQSDIETQEKKLLTFPFAVCNNIFSSQRKSIVTTNRKDM